MQELNRDRIPFPPISEAIKRHFSLGDLSLRRFGILGEDREVNFNQPLRPYLEVEILECCTCDGNDIAPNRDFFWSLELGTRIECLLAIATIPGRSEFTIPLRCLNPECKQSIEIDFSMEEFSNLQAESKSDTGTEIEIGNQRFSIRKPTGFDQLYWLKQSFPDEKSAVQTMLQTLLTEEQKATFDPAALAGENWVQMFDRAMEDIDPLVNFKVGVNCPYCGKQDSHSIDLGEFSLQRLQNAQKYLLETIHRLASRYHWNEREISELPAWRRDYYLAIIDREENR
ncbi:MAG: hypothetical protein MUE44_06460 [Oscillatoriaceae cyanobacterium Prado104]|jgi:hypothetical protein|nr:hypothetical protein [Oscillatoriaceae cyanobacterium Prado104]